MKNPNPTCWKLLAVFCWLAAASGGVSAPVTVIDDISASTTWQKTNEYYLDGYVYVLGGAVLTIEPGTVVKGLEVPTTGETASALFVTAGAKIMAEGAAAEPIVFTSEYDDVSDPDDMGIFERGKWGGW